MEAGGGLTSGFRGYFSNLLSDRNEEIGFDASNFRFRRHKQMKLRLTNLNTKLRAAATTADFQLLFYPPSLPRVASLFCKPREPWKPSKRAFIGSGESPSLVQPLKPSHGIKSVEFPASSFQLPDSLALRLPVSWAQLARPFCLRNPI